MTYLFDEDAAQPGEDVWFSRPSDLTCEVHLAEYPLRPGRPELELLERKQCLWRHEVRNQAIAGIAQAVLSRNKDALAQHRLFFQDGELPSLITSCDWLVVLVESVVHALKLHELLPDFAVDALIPNLPAKPLVTPLTGTIATLLAAERIERFVPSVVIIAMGGPYIPPLDDLMPRGFGHHFVLIDMDDDFDPQVVGDTELRISRYLAQEHTCHSSRRDLPVRGRRELHFTYEGGRPPRANKNTKKSKSR